MLFPANKLHSYHADITDGKKLGRADIRAYHKLILPCKLRKVGL